MFTEETTPATVNQSKDVLSNLTDNQKEYLKSLKSVFFDPENDPEQCQEVLMDYKEGWEGNVLEDSEEDIPEETTKSDDDLTFNEYTITGDKLVQIAVDSIPHLWYPYFPTTGLVGISGASEAGKSTFARQLALAICNDETTFLEQPLYLQHKSVLYISTEDDQTSMSVQIKKQTLNRYKDGLLRFRLGLNVANVFLYIKKELTKQKADLVVIDVWADLYGESSNELSKVRKNLNNYSMLCRLFKTCICIIHHNTKHSKDNEPSKTNLNGSQAIEAKLRTLLELRDLGNGTKQIAILKANYIPYTLKKQKTILTQSDDLNLQFERFEDLNTNNSNKSPKSSDNEVKLRTIELYATGKYSQDEVVKVLEEEFDKKRAPSKGTVNKWLKEKNGQSKELIEN